jgi:hypothetical protein
LGFNERTDAREIEQRIKSRAAKGDIDALNMTWPMEQWTKAIRASLDEFANEPQNGEMLRGASPCEAWGDGLDKIQPRKFAEEERYIVASHAVPARITEKGIIITIRGTRYLYANEFTGALLRRGVTETVGFYHIEYPELLTFRGERPGELYSAKRLMLPAMSATKDQFQEVNHAIKGHRDAVKTIFGGIRHPRVANITRDDSTDDETKEIGRFINQQIKDHKADEAVRERKLRKVQRFNADHGLPVPAIKNPDRVLQAQRLEEELLAEIQREENQ